MGPRKFSPNYDGDCYHFICSYLAQATIEITMKEVFSLNILPKEVCQKPLEPVLFKGAVKNWPALEKWSWEYLKQLGGERLVRLVVGNREQNSPQFTQMNFSQYIDRLATNNDKSQQLYLKEFNLFEEFPPLQLDVDYSSFFPWYVTPGKFAWIGEKGACTGLHYDIFDNFLTQISGKKKFFLLANEEISAPYRSDKFDYGARVALVDGFNPDYNKFPLFAKAKPIVVELVPGDVLYIPKGWWHQVKSLDPTISIASFMVTIKDRWTTELWENTKRFLHNRGLYKQGNCTCCHSNN